MPNEPEPPPLLEHSGERVTLGRPIDRELSGGSEDAQDPQAPGTGADQIAMDPKLGDGDAVTHGKMKGMLQDPALVAAMSEAARRGPRDTERELRGPKKPYFLNTQQFRDACDLAGVKQGPAEGGATQAPAHEDATAPARADVGEPGPTSEPKDAKDGSQRRRFQALLLVLGGAALLVAILAIAWPREPSSDPLQVGAPESSTDALATEQPSSAASKGTGGAQPGSAPAPSGAAAGAPSGSAAAPAVSHSARASATASAARSAAPSSATSTHAPAPTAVPSATRSLPFPIEGQ